MWSFGGTRTLAERTLWIGGGGDKLLTETGRKESLREGVGGYNVCIIFWGENGGLINKWGESWGEWGGQERLRL